MPQPPSDIKQPDKKLKARGLTVYISDIRNCVTREQEEERVAQELANIRSKFAQSKTKPLSSYDRRKYVWKLVYTYLLGYDVDFGHMQAIELLASPVFSEKMCGYLSIGVLLKGTDELMTLVINTIKRDLSPHTPEQAQCLALCAVANIGGRDMAHALGDDVKRLAMSESTSLMARKKAVLALLRIHRETPQAVHLPTELEVAQLIESKDLPLNDNLGLGMCAASLLKHMINLANETDERRQGDREGEEDDDPDEAKAREIRSRQRPQVQAIIVRKFHQLSVGRLCAPNYHYHGTAAPFLQVILLQVLRAIKVPPSVGEIRFPLAEGLRWAIANVKWSKSSTMNNSSRCVAFEAIALVVEYGKESKNDLVDASIELLGRFAASKNANTRYLALGSMTNIAKTVQEQYTSHKEAASDRWQKALANQQNSIIASLKDPDSSVRKRALDLLFHVCNEHNAASVIDELLAHLQIATEELKEELILRIAVLAERFAKAPKWYLDIALRLLQAGDELVGDDVWHRVAQIVANQDELQQYAALKMYKALLQPGHVPSSLVKCASYILGEFGYLLTEYSTLDKGDLDHDVLPIDLFGACHRHFMVADTKTKIVLLTTYSKLLNIYEDLEAPVEEVFDSQKRSIDVELQQRAIEYASLSRINVQTMNQVLEPMPPWPVTNRESKLEQQLEKLSKSGSGNEKSKSAAASSPKVVDPRSPTISEVKSISPRVNEASYKRKAPENLIDLDQDHQEPPPRPQPNSPSALHLAHNRKLYLNALLTSKSLLYEDATCQLGSHQTFSKGHAQVELFLGNLSTTATIQDTYFETSNPESDALAMDVPPGATKNDRIVVAPAAQVRFAFTFKCLKPFMASPELILVHALTGHHLARARLPVALGSFLEPFSMTSDIFARKWAQLESNPDLSKFKVAQLDNCPDSVWPNAVSKCYRLIDLQKMFRVPDWPLTMPMQDSHDVAGAAVLTFAQDTPQAVVGVLARIEINDSLKALRVSVRSTQAEVAQCLLVNLFSQASRLFSDE